MSQADKLERVSAPEADLELPGLGMRFASEDTERKFGEWRLARATRGVVVSLRVTSVVWLGVLVLLWVARPEGVAPWAAGIAAIFIGIAATYFAVRAKSSAAVELSLLVSLALAGELGLGIANVHLDSFATGLATTVWACLFQFRATIVRPTYLAVAVSTYVLTELYLVVRAVSSGTVTPGIAAIDVFLVLSAFAIGLLGAVGSAGSRRRSYRQQCIIERQAETIARERVRSEALFKQELSHQVAERSRELGAVLARSDVTLDARKLVVGERFAERYRVVAPLGAGGMGAVYEVERVTDGQRLALKAVVGEVSGPSAARFAREAEIGARVRHEHLVSIVDVGVSTGVPYLAMELVPGGSLEAQRARFGDVPWALPILRQIAMGLAALHDAGVVHRDLKPANVLLADGVAKISDFGISRFGALDEATSIDPAGPTIGASPAPRTGLVTGTGVIMGTPLYMAPEAARSAHALDARADVFALGILAYEMLTGRAPFSVPAVVLAMAQQPTPTAAPIDDARVPAALCTLVLDCLAGDPTRRPKVLMLLAQLG